MPNKIVGSIPNIITLCNLLAGCVAIYMAFHQGEQFGALSGLQCCWIAIAAAAVFDFCDGASARLLKAYSNVGKELDSLSDLVSFGVAPGMMVMNIIMQNAEIPALGFLALVIPMLGAYRLAKFNVDESQTTSFVGLPIPANAIFWIGFSGWIMHYGYPGTGVMIVLAVVVSWLMICKLRMFSLKFKNFDFRENFRRYALLAGSAAFIAVWGIRGLMWAIVFYILLSLMGRKDFV